MVFASVSRKLFQVQQNDSLESHLAHVSDRKQTVLTDCLPRTLPFISARVQGWLMRHNYFLRKPSKAHLESNYFDYIVLCLVFATLTSHQSKRRNGKKFEL